jgi:hypothetical protein
LAFELSNIARTVSITILCIFTLEFAIRIILIPKHLKHAGFVLDVFVVVTSLIMEFTLHHSSGLIMLFFRLWRFVRIFHGIFEYMHDVFEYCEAATLLRKAVVHWSEALDRETHMTEFLKRRQLYAEYRAALRDALQDVPCNLAECLASHSMNAQVIKSISNGSSSGEQMMVLREASMTVAVDDAEAKAMSGKANEGHRCHVSFSNEKSTEATRTSKEPRSRSQTIETIMEPQAHQVSAVVTAESINRSEALETLNDGEPPRTRVVKLADSVESIAQIDESSSTTLCLQSAGPESVQ